MNCLVAILLWVAFPQLWWLWLLIALFWSDSSSGEDRR